MAEKYGKNYTKAFINTIKEKAKVIVTGKQIGRAHV